MKGVILAGGKGTRMYPLTQAVNKHLLPVGNKPMIQHCVEKMTEANIREIIVVTGGEHLGGIAEFLGGGSRFGCEFSYRVQEEAGGIAQALGLAKGFVGNDTMCVLLGDNIFKDSLKRMVEVANACTNWYASGAMVALKQVPDAQRFGVATIKNGRIVGIEEKPKRPKSDLAVTGIYFYSMGVFHVISELKPSKRGELEITDVNNWYASQYRLGHVVMKGWWTDAGTHESYKRANDLVRRK